MLKDGLLSTQTNLNKQELRTSSPDQKINYSIDLNLYQ
jgi:hypothetical protein